MPVLVISEKDDAAKRIAGHLSEGKAKGHKYGRNTRYYTWDADGDEWRCIGLKGHLVELDYPKQYRSWARTKIQDLVWAEPERKIARGGKERHNAVTKLGKDADRVIIATDFDREGELIGVEGLEIVQAANPDIPAFRARFSSLTKKEIQASFQRLVEVDHNLAAAAESRQRVDLAWGAALTRLLTMASRSGSNDVVSVGRVQSPTLALIVDKEKEIQAFEPEPYWEITARVRGDPPFEAEHTGNRFEKGGEAQAAYEAAQSATQASVTGYTTRKVTEAAQTPFNTTAFQVAASKIGMTASRAMNIAEALYMQGYISYPRTDNTVYPPDEDLDEILRGIATIPEYKPLVEALADVRRDQPTRGKKTATDHPPIHPMEPAPKAKLEPEQWKVYDLVVRRFLATLAVDAEGETQRAELDINGQPFKATGYRVLKSGWKRFYPFAGRQEKVLPALTEGDVLPVSRVEIEEKMTQPPGRYGQGRLIQEMEKLDLGTKSTRHEIIRVLSGRDYVVSPSQLEPTEIGFALIDALEKHADIIAKPEMTAQLERDMAKVAKGEMRLEDVVKASCEMLEAAAATVEEHRQDIGSQIGDALRKLNTMGACPQCGKDLIKRIARRTRRRFIGCSGWPECEQTYPLPQQGKIERVGETCSECGSPRLRRIGRGRPWEFCANMDCPTNERNQKKEGDQPAEATTEA